MLPAEARIRTRGPWTLLLLFGVLSCGEGGSEPTEVETPVASTVVVTPSTQSLEALGQTAQLTAQVRDQKGSVMAGASVTWSSSAPAVVSVSSVGLATAVSEGVAAVSARAGSASGAASITVQVVPGTVSGSVYRDLDGSGGHGGGEGVAGVTLQFPAADGSGLGGTTTTAADGSYSVDLNPGTYGFRVLPTETLIGDPTGIDTLNVDTSPRSTHQVDVPVVLGAQSEVTETGGTIQTEKGVSVSIPSGAVSQDTVISVVPAEVSVGGKTYQAVSLYPEGLAFQDELTLVIPLAQPEALLGPGERGPQVYFHDPETGEDFLVPTTVNTSTGNVEARIRHFSDYWLDVDAGAVFGPGGYTYQIAAVPSDIVNGGTQEFSDAVDRAFGRWKEPLAQAGISFTRDDAGSDPTIRILAADGESMGWDDPEGCSVQADSPFGTGLGTRSGAIVLNDNCSWVSAEEFGRRLGIDENRTDSFYDLPLLEGILVHEVGHALGLGHFRADQCAGGESDPLCWSPPTMAPYQTSPSLGPLYEEDLQLMAARYGLGAELGRTALLEVNLLEGTQDQTGPEGQTVPVAPGVTITDQDGSPVSGVTVVFFTEGANGTVEGGVQVTGQDGIAQVDGWRLGPVAVGEHGLRATLSTAQETQASFTATPQKDLFVATETLAGGTQGLAYSGTLAGTGGVLPYSWSVSAGALPDGLVLHPTSGVIDGVPTSLGLFNVTVRVDDALGLWDEKSFDLTVISGAYDCQGQTHISLAECLALVALYEDTGGSDWHNSTGWISTPEPCAWHGVACDEEGVAGLHLAENNLKGSLPASLANLPYVRNLDFNGNLLTGSIPSWLGTLGTLESLSLAYCELMTGPIPPELGNLQALKVLRLGGSYLSGTLPPELGGLSKLEELYVTGMPTGMSISGPIPPELGDLANLKVLNLWQNRLSGAIPDELANLSNLEALVLGRNQLTGSIPSWLANFSNLEDLVLDSNQLTGPIPSGLANLSNLAKLGLGFNQLTGPIPPELGDLRTLLELSLAGNEISGTIPDELANLSNLDFLYLGSNQLTGPIPSWLGDLSSLTWVNLRVNQLSGPIPTELGNLSQLLHLDLGLNQLSGAIPTELGNLSQLTRLRLRDNQLSGPIPAALGNLSKLDYLNLETNQLSGPIPTEFSNLSSLTRVFLAENQLSGVIPLPVAQHGGIIQGTTNADDCRWVPPGNTGLTIPDQATYRAADLDGDGKICGVVIGG